MSRQFAGLTTAGAADRRIGDTLEHTGSRPGKGEHRLLDCLSSFFLQMLHVRDKRIDRIFEQIQFVN